jgi:hypothetical protein
MDAITSAQAGHLFTDVPEPGRIRRTLCVRSRLSLRAVAVIPARLTCTQQVILYFGFMLESYIHITSHVVITHKVYCDSSLRYLEEVKRWKVLSLFHGLQETFNF